MTGVDGNLVGTVEVAEATGVNLRTLQHWAGWGIIRPANDVTGSGNRWLWDADEVRVVGVVGQLRHIAGVGRPIEGFMGCPWPLLRQLARDHDSGWLLIADDGRVGWTDDPDRLYRWMRTAGVAVTVGLDNLPGTDRPLDAA